jgi:hypothetical protein
MSDNEFRGESENPPSVDTPLPSKRRRRKGNSGAQDDPQSVETTFKRADSRPDQTQPAPEPTPSQDAAALDDELASALAPDDEDADLSEAELGPPHYTTIPRKTSPPRMIPIRIFPKTVGATTVYMLSVVREAQDDGDQDTYLLAQTVRAHLAGHPAFQKRIRRFQIRLGVTALGKPFFLEINLDDQGVCGQSRRDLAARAESEWLMVSSDRNAGYVYYEADHFADPVVPQQGYTELYRLAYRSCLISSFDHPIIVRGALRKTTKK